MASRHTRRVVSHFCFLNILGPYRRLEMSRSVAYTNKHKTSMTDTTVTCAAPPVACRPSNAMPPRQHTEHGDSNTLRARCTKHAVMYSENHRFEWYSQYRRTSSRVTREALCREQHKVACIKACAASGAWSQATAERTVHGGSAALGQGTPPLWQ